MTEQQQQSSLLEQFDLLRRIDEAILRLSDLPPTDSVTQSILNLRMKRGWVADGQYALRQVNEEACAAIGREISLMIRIHQTRCKNLLRKSP